MPDVLTLLVAEPVITVAYVVFGLVGFGSTLVSAPLLAHLLPVSTVVPTLALTDMIASWSNGWRLSQHVARQELVRLVPALFAGSALGAWLLFTLPVKLLMPLLGAFVVLYALNGLRPKAVPSPISPRWAWWYGSVGGVFSALFGAGGWVYSVYLLRRLDDPQQIRATQTAVLMFSSVVRVALFLLAGRLLDTQLLWLVLALLPAVGLGLFIGHHISLRLDRRRFLLLLHSVLLLTGSSLLLRSLI
ncbi:MAG: sulfite exporter TauE/SafE family protein [Hylemonella sp.]|nr:sulfite exporter TauE/SafE family protein [Hylemonella sp.]MDP1938992.1 sulfite exporter TauE/SafE family protein [Hylemonella sp.]